MIDKAECLEDIKTGVIALFSFLAMVEENKRDHIKFVECLIGKYLHGLSDAGARCFSLEQRPMG